MSKVISTLLIALVALWGHAAQAEEITLPTDFAISDGGPFRGYAIMLRDGRYMYESRSNGKVRKLRLKPPTRDRWKQFWSNMEALRVNKWVHVYEWKEAGVIVSDETRWSVRIGRKGGISVDSHGINCYPSDSDPARAEKSGLKTGTFRGLEKAIGDLFRVEELLEK